MKLFLKHTINKVFIKRSVKVAIVAGTILALGKSLWLDCQLERHKGGSFSNIADLFGSVCCFNLWICYAS